MVATVLRRFNCQFIERRSVAYRGLECGFRLVVSLGRTCCVVVRWFVCRGDRVGRAGCLSLLLMESLSTASHFELSSAVQREVMSLVAENKAALLGTPTLKNKNFQHVESNSNLKNTSLLLYRSVPEYVERCCEGDFSHSRMVAPLNVQRDAIHARMCVYDFMKKLLLLVVFEKMASDGDDPKDAENKKFILRSSMVPAT